MSPAGEVTTLAGLAGTSGSADGTGSAARFFYPYGVAVDSAGDVWVADSSNGAVRKVSPEGVVTTLATGLAGPYGVATAPSGAVYVSNTNQYDIRSVYPVIGAVPVAGLAGNSGSADGTGTVARFFLPALIAAADYGYQRFAFLRELRSIMGEAATVARTEKSAEIVRAPVSRRASAG